MPGAVEYTGGPAARAAIDEPISAASASAPKPRTSGRNTFMGVPPYQISQRVAAG